MFPESILYPREFFNEFIYLAASLCNHFEHDVFPHVTFSMKMEFDKEGRIFHNVPSSSLRNIVSISERKYIARMQLPRRCSMMHHSRKLVENINDGLSSRGDLDYCSFASQ